MSFFEELKRRNVFRVGIAYQMATWPLFQVTNSVTPRIGLPDLAATLVIKTDIQPSQETHFGLF